MYVLREQKDWKRYRTWQKKARRIKEILDELRENKEKEKVIREKEIERREQQHREKISREQKRKEKIEKQRQLQERWALLRWTTEFINENSDKWEQEKKIREQEREQVIRDWEKRTRHEKIRLLREKFWEKRSAKNNPEPDSSSQKTREQEQRWSIWRKIEKPEPCQPTMEGEQIVENPPAQVKLVVKLKQPRLNFMTPHPQQTPPSRTRKRPIEENSAPACQEKMSQDRKLPENRPNTSPPPQKTLKIAPIFTKMGSNKSKIQPKNDENLAPACQNPPPKMPPIPRKIKIHTIP